MINLKIIAILIFASQASILMSQAPKADFQNCDRVVEVYDIIQFTDLSEGNPTEWTWDVYDSFTNNFVASLSSGDVFSDPWGNGNDEFSQNPEFSFDFVGCYTIVLTAKNANGESTLRKLCYIKVIPSTNYNLGYGTYGPQGDNRVYSDYGQIFDDGGENLNYNNGTNSSKLSYLKLTPFNNKNITLDFKQIRFADIYDSLYIFDSDQFDMNKLIAVLNSNNNGQYPSFTSTTPNMYVYFTSNSSGVDSGFKAEFYAGTKPSNPQLSFSIDSSGENQMVRFINEYNATKRFAYDLQWYVDDSLYMSYNNKDTFNFTYTKQKDYKICLKAVNCDSTLEYCQTLSFTLGVKAIQNQNKNYSVYPNPFTNQIQVKTTGSNQILEIKIFNEIGKEITYKPLQKDGEFCLLMDKSLPPGLYLLQVKNSLGEVGYVKLVKN
ncbi:MAG: T9SS type A sorting domain-containing protein [Bacteroidia bacterium]